MITPGNLRAPGEIYDHSGDLRAPRLPEREEIIYQAVAGTGPNGIFEYELFSFNWKTYETKQLTNLKSYTAKPILGPDNEVYFLVDRQFGGRLPDYQIYKMFILGENVQEVLTIR